MTSARTIIVTGSRDGCDAGLLTSTLDAVYKDLAFTLLVVGSDKGVDAQAVAWAKKNKVDVKIVLANWEKHGRAAGPIRNSFMLKEHPETLAVVSFPGGRGTEDCTRKAEALGYKVVKARSIKR